MTENSTKPAEKEKKKTSIHERTGYGPMDIYKVELAFHPRSKEIVDQELTELVDQIFKEHVEKGSVKDADKAADAFIEAFAKYHFGEGSKDLNIDHIKHILRDQYGISRDALKKAFKRKGAYKTREHFYREHKTPFVDRADQAKKQQAQEALEEYRTDEYLREELAEHIEKRVGKPLSKSFKEILPLDKLVNLIGTYIALPGAVEKIEQDKKATLNLPDAQAGHPDLYDSFKEGDKYRKVYHEEAEKVDGTHKLTTKKKAN